MRPPAHRYGTRSRLLHWGSVALIVVVFIYSGQFGDLQIDERRTLHNSYGLLLLALMVVRIWWRRRTADPLESYTLPTLQKSFARCVHYVLYALLLAQSMLGMLIVVLDGGSSFFGLYEFTPFSDASPEFAKTLKPMHAALANGMLALIATHVLAAIGHLIFGIKPSTQWPTKSELD